MDVSNNRRVNQYPESNAEYLSSLLPDSVVVKGFNVISAWTLQQSCLQDSSTQVHHGKWILSESFIRFILRVVFLRATRGQCRVMCCRLRVATGVLSCIFGVQCTKRRIGSSIVIKKDGILS